MKDEARYFKLNYLDEIEDMEFYLSDGDPTRCREMDETNMELIYKFYYRKRENKLNELISSVEQLEKSSK
ncbi:MAG: hypothetical protein LCH52_05415 [Bacteroidetes bacterium]|nr:hypothetical protein [Bacteroidota bacterium]